MKQTLNCIYLKYDEIKRNNMIQFINQNTFRYTKMEADAYTKEGQPMNILSIHRFSKAECVIYIDRIWKFNDMFVCKWKLKTIYLR